MKRVLIILLLTTCCQKGWAEVRDYALNQMEVMNGSGNIKTVPILTSDRKPITLKLVISGITEAGIKPTTDRITAQCPVLSLSTKTQIYPLDKNNGTGINGSGWYYITHSQGVTIIELKGRHCKSS